MLSIIQVSNREHYFLSKKKIKYKIVSATTNSLAMKIWTVHSHQRPPLLWQVFSTNKTDCHDSYNWNIGESGVKHHKQTSHRVLFHHRRGGLIRGGLLYLQLNFFHITRRGLNIDILFITEQMYADCISLFFPPLESRHVQLRSDILWDVLQAFVYWYGESPGPC